MNSLIAALEKKRGELGLRAEDFAHRLKLGNSPNSSRTAYSTIVNGRRKFPKKKYALASEILGITSEKVRELAQIEDATTDIKIRTVPNIEIGAEDLRYLAGIAEAAGGKLPLYLLVHHLLHKTTQK